MMIQEEHVRFVAAAEVTDDYRVQVRLRRRKVDLTISQARALIADVARSIGYAEEALADLIRSPGIFGFDTDALPPCLECGALVRPDDEHADQGFCGECMQDTSCSPWKAQDNAVKRDRDEKRDEGDW